MVCGYRPKMYEKMKENERRKAMETETDNGQKAYQRRTGSKFVSSTERERENLGTNAPSIDARAREKTANRNLKQPH